MAKLYRSPVFFFRLQLLLFLITNEFNLMFCWAQFTFSIAFAQKLTTGLSDLLPCFPHPGSSPPANSSAPCLEREIMSKTTPQTRPRLPSTEKPPHSNCSTSLNEQTKSNPGSPWALLIHTEMQWHHSCLACQPPTAPPSSQQQLGRHSRGGGERNEKGPTLTEGRHTASLLLFKYG